MLPIYRGMPLIAEEVIGELGQNQENWTWFYNKVLKVVVCAADWYLTE